jgi:hypothetical protein
MESGIEGEDAPSEDQAIRQGITFSFWKNKGVTRVVSGYTVNTPIFRKGDSMEATMSLEEVVDQIRQLEARGKPLTKKKVKQSYPELLQNALYYYPSWEHAVKNSISPENKLK